MFFWKDVKTNSWLLMQWCFILLYGVLFFTFIYCFFNTNILILIPTSIKHIYYEFYADKLTWFFESLFALGGALSNVYSLEYIKDEDYKNKFLLVLLVNTFIISMMGVAISYDIFSFLTFWEMMSVFSFLLVIFDFEKEENFKASVYYIVMTHVGTIFILLSFLGFYLNTKSTNFLHWTNTHLDFRWALFVFACSVIGFGMKAGFIGLHNWLPKAHPVAPSFVSALMSGLMIKLPVYMFIRYYFYFLKDYPSSFGFFIIIISLFTMLFGILNASIQSMLKKILAYSSMENIGIITLGIGLAMVFKSYGFYKFSYFILMASIFHILNHFLFKSLLFMGAGSVITRTHTQDINKLGGLIKRMPRLSIVKLIAVLSISALPPFNGFVSEWLLYQGILISAKTHIKALTILSIASASFLALTGGIAMLTFVKYFGLSFLGKARKIDINRISDIGFFSFVSLSILASLCFILGIMPFIALFFIKRLFGVDWFNKDFGVFMIYSPMNFGYISPVFIAFGIIISILLVYLYLSKPYKIYKTWACGLSNVPSIAQYSADGFSQPIKKITHLLYPKNKDLFDVIYEYVFTNVVYFMQKLKNKIQSGVLQVYIAYMAITILIVVMVAKYV